MSVRGVVLDAFVRDLFEERFEIDGERFRIILARSGLDVVPLDGGAVLAAPAIANDPAADDARLEIRRDELRREGAKAFLARIEQLVVQARVGSGRLEEAVLLSDIENEMDVLLEGLDVADDAKELAEKVAEKAARGGKP